MTSIDSHFLLKRDIGRPFFREQTSEWNARVISNNVTNGQYVEHVIKLMLPLASWALQDPYLATCQAREPLDSRAKISATVDLWLLPSCRKVWSYTLEDWSFRKRSLQMTDDYHVILPFDSIKEEITLVSADKQFKNISVRLTEKSIVTTTDNQIVVLSDQTFSVWNTDGNKKWELSFSEQIRPQMAAITPQYFACSFYNVSTSLTMLFVADLVQHKSLTCPWETVLNEKKFSITALEMEGDTLYAGTADPHDSFDIDLFIATNPKIHALGLSKTEQLFTAEVLSTFTPPFKGSIELMISNGSQLAYTQYFSEKSKAPYRFALLDWKEKKETKTFSFRNDLFPRDLGKQTFFNFENKYICGADGRLEELSSFAENSCIGPIQAHASFANGMFVWLDDDIGHYGDHIVVRDYNWPE